MKTSQVLLRRRMVLRRARSAPSLASVSAAQSRLELFGPINALAIAKARDETRELIAPARHREDRARGRFGQVAAHVCVCFHGDGNGRPDVDFFYSARSERSLYEQLDFVQDPRPIEILMKLHRRQHQTGDRMTSDRV